MEQYKGMTGMKRALFAWLVVLCLGGAVAAQSPLAAVLEVAYPGVELLRKDTSAWLPLPEGAVAPLSSGDVLRTDATGRAYVRFLEDDMLFLLPNTRLEVQAFSQQDDTAQLSGRLTGIAVLHGTWSTRLALQAGMMRLDRVDGRLALWADSNEADTVTVSSGRAAVTVAGMAYTVEAGQGLRVQGDAVQIAAFDAPHNQARLIGALDGCPGTIQTVNDAAGVLLRNGPGTGYLRRDRIEDGQATALLGRTDIGWVRVQHANGIGWVTETTVETDCALPTIEPREEDATQVVNADERELRVLEPFFGSPLFDGFFYVFDGA